MCNSTNCKNSKNRNKSVIDTYDTYECIGHVKSCTIHSKNTYLYAPITKILSGLENNVEYSDEQNSLWSCTKGKTKNNIANILTKPRLKRTLYT